jgi:hypothetical protein
MILLLTLVGFAIVALLLGWKAVRGQAVPQGDPEQLTRQIRHVDLHAFRNLFDLRDEEYLRQHISPQDFRAWQKLRTHAALEYLAWTSRNAALLLAIGEMATRSSDISVASHGRELANVALSLRINCILAMLKLYLKLIYPSPRISIDPVFDRYAKVRSSFVSLSFAQHPASVSKTFAIL